MNKKLKNQGSKKAKIVNISIRISMFHKGTLNIQMNCRKVNNT